MYVCGMYARLFFCPWRLRLARGLVFTDYRRQFPASPIVADSAVAGDDGVPAVSLPHDKNHAVDSTRPPPERQSTPNVESPDRDTVTCLIEPMLLVDGVMGLPLKGQPSDRGTALLSNPLHHNREGRLLTAKKKLLVRMFYFADIEGRKKRPTGVSLPIARAVPTVQTPLCSLLLSLDRCNSSM